ncbi:MAG: hypothetical protein COS84_01055 [Armatimonadetes bacterium CG07_land_8_20_14_0_80_40_9]|nr:MAG: hypothetical protein COS84_01055 [Armatimonadetes bacterium CG07_land_8_20_14_0_80_40_9]
MALNSHVIESLKRESFLFSSAITYYNHLIKDMENKYEKSTEQFLKEFEGGILGDSQEFFDWYAYVRLRNGWIEMQKAIDEVIN